MKIAIAEDDRSHSEQLRRYLDQYAQEQGLRMEVTAYDSGEALLDEFAHQFDLIFLDIAMEKLDGVEAARCIRAQDPDVAIIFVTNLAQYAIRGYEVDALDYILKPVTYFAFSQRLSRAIRRVRPVEKRFIMLSDRNGMVKLDIASVTYVESRGHELVYHTQQGTHVVAGTIRDAEAALSQFDFYRCNKGYLVSLRHVDGIRESCALVGGEELLISRARKAGFLEALTNYIGGGRG